MWPAGMQPVQIRVRDLNRSTRLKIKIHSIAIHLQQSRTNECALSFIHAHVPYLRDSASKNSILNVLWFLHDRMVMSSFPFDKVIYSILLDSSSGNILQVWQWLYPPITVVCLSLSMDIELDQGRMSRWLISNWYLSYFWSGFVNFSIVRPRWHQALASQRIDMLTFACQALRFCRMLKLIRAARLINKLNKLKQRVR